MATTGFFDRPKDGDNKTEDINKESIVVNDGEIDCVIDIDRKVSGNWRHIY